MLINTEIWVTMMTRLKLIQKDGKAGIETKIAIPQTRVRVNVPSSPATCFQYYANTYTNTERCSKRETS
jgi:hypothetical protein